MTKGEKWVASRYGPHPVDLRVGARLRERRLMLRMSQQQLADSVGITFQQVQKYENGTNRISASRLFELSRSLEVPIAWFFEGLEGADAAPPPTLSRRDAEIAGLLHGLRGTTVGEALLEIAQSYVRRRTNGSSHPDLR